MHSILSLAILAFAALSQAAPAAAPQENQVANIEARKAKLTTIGYTTKTFTATITATIPIVTKIKKTKTTTKNGKKTTVTETVTSTLTSTATSTVVSTTTSPIVSTVISTTTTTAQPAPTSTLAPTTTAAGTTTTEAPSSTTTTAAVSATPTAASQSRSCEQLPGTFTDSNGRSYTNTCNTDAYGGDLDLIYTNSFEDCYSVCDSTDGCVGFVYGGGASDGPCYLKSSIQPAAANDAEDLAILN